MYKFCILQYFGLCLCATDSRQKTGRGAVQKGLRITLNNNKKVT